MEGRNSLDRYVFLYAGDNECPTILMEIRQVMFPNLSKMYLQNNNIESLEGFSRVYLPELKWLSLRTISGISDSNDICNISDLKKGHWLNLNRLWLSNK